MNGYRIKYDEAAEKDIKGLSPVSLQKIKKRVEWLADNVRQIRHQALKGVRYKNRFKLRVGAY